MTQSKQNLNIIAFVGLAGSGKSTAVEYFTEKGIPKVYFGGVILDAMKEAGIERTADSERAFREAFRQEHGNDAVVNKIIEQITNLGNAGQRDVIADGLYTWTEYKALKRAFPGDLTVIAVVAPRHLRYRRLAQRPERPFNSTEAYERDMSEIENLEKGGPIAIADHFVINDGNVEALHERLDELSSLLELSR